MSIIPGKSLAAALAALAVAAGVQAQEKVLYSENFEEAIPGQTPKKWTKVWGSPGSDIFAVTTEQAAGGDHALLLTRGDNQGQWGFGVAFPHVDREPSKSRSTCCWKVPATRPVSVLKSATTRRDG